MICLWQRSMNGEHCVALRSEKRIPPWICIQGGNCISIVNFLAIFNLLITFVSAPEYFGDGYCMPIVALSVNGEELLTFDEGVENLIAQY